MNNFAVLRFTKRVLYHHYNYHNTNILGRHLHPYPILQTGMSLLQLSFFYLAQAQRYFVGGNQGRVRAAC